MRKPFTHVANDPVRTCLSLYLEAIELLIFCYLSLGGHNEGVGLVAYSSSSEEEEEKGGEAGEGGTQGGEGGGGESKSSTRTSRERKLRDSGATKGLTKNNPPTGDIADSPPLYKRQRLDHEDHHLTEQWVLLSLSLSSARLSSLTAILFPQVFSSSSPSFTAISFPGPGTL